MKYDIPQIQEIIQLALQEDIGTGDITTLSIVQKSKKGKAVLIAKENGIISGLPIAKLICKKIDKKIIFTPKIKEGTKVFTKTVIAELHGPFHSLLTVERTILNFLQRMSGISTQTSEYVAKLNGLNTRILDTRKTSPGLRLLDKYAVKVGGGKNHRVGLFDMVLIKENHISSAGSITEAVKLCRANSKRKIKIEVEVSTLKDVLEAISAKVNIIMLDNMTLNLMRKAVKLIDKKCKVEASGGITLDSIKDVAKTGVDFISVGSLTHSVNALDIAMYISEVEDIHGVQ